MSHTITYFDALLLLNAEPALDSLPQLDCRSIVLCTRDCCLSERPSKSNFPEMDDYVANRKLSKRAHCDSIKSCFGALNAFRKWVDCRTAGVSLGSVPRQCKGTDEEQFKAAGDGSHPACKDCFRAGMGRTLGSDVRCPPGGFQLAATLRGGMPGSLS